MKTVVNSLIMSIIKLRDAAVLTIFVLSIFALIGLQLYSGTLLQKCVKRFDNSSILYSSFGDNVKITWEMKMQYFNDQSMNLTKFQ